MYEAQMRQMFFGTREYMQWIKQPMVEMPSSKSGFANKMDFLNGGANVQRSTTARKEYTLSWAESSTRDDIRPIMDYADRLYGEGPFYFCDPFVMEKNVLPQWFASPFQGLDDGPPLNGGKRGTLVQTSSNAFGYPTRSITYTVSTSIPTLKLWIPTPPGYTTWVGAHGQAGTGGTVVVTPSIGTSDGAPTTLTLLGVNTDTRVNASFDSATYTGITISLGGSGTITLSGIMVQQFPTGATPPSGAFISGQGNSGCEFTEQPEYTPYSAALDEVGLSVGLVEIGGWR